MKVVFAFVLLFAVAFSHPANVPVELPYVKYENDGLERAINPDDRKCSQKINHFERNNQIISIT